MNRDAAGLVTRVRDHVGRDAYVVYPDARRMIPEAVLWGFASACILEYLKAFVDLKGLGERSRAAVLELLRRWRERDGFEQFVAAERVEALVAEVVAIAPDEPAGDDRARAVELLDRQLRGFGMRPVDAHRHALAVAATLYGAP